MALNNRIAVQNIDRSGFATATTNETGAMVIKSSKGPTTPVLCYGEKDVLLTRG